VISGFRREVAENYVLLGCYTAISDSILQTFRDNLSVPSSGVKNPVKNRRMGQTSPKTLVRNYHYPLCNNPEERSSQVTSISPGGEGLKAACALD